MVTVSQTCASEQILNDKSSQLGYTVAFTSAHAGEYRAEDKIKTDTTETKHNPEKANKIQQKKSSLV